MKGCLNSSLLAHLQRPNAIPRPLHYIPNTVNKNKLSKYLKIKEFHIKKGLQFLLETWEMVVVVV